jgi:hypothetical protein
MFNNIKDVVKGWNQIFRNDLDENSFTSAEKQAVLDNFIISEGFPSSF